MKKDQHLKISVHEKLWLEELYKTINANKRPSYRVLRAKLHKSLPVDFDPKKIDKRLTNYSGEEITIEGVNIIDPKIDIINKANKVIKAIKSLLLDNPEKDEVNVTEISEIVDLTKKEIAFILRLISPYGKFWSSASGSQEFYNGYESLRIQNENQIFDQYLYFTDIRDLIQKYNTELEKGQRVNERVFYTTEEQHEEGVRLNPIFKSEIRSIDKNICFVLMPFKEPWSNEIYKLIKSTIESLGFQCLRADDLNGQIIIEDIWIKINQAGFIIADVTNKNPNVMYEVGIAHTVGRPTLLLTQNLKDISFDVTHLRHIEYKNSFSGPSELKKKLKEAITDLHRPEKELTISKKSLITIKKKGNR